MKKSSVIALTAIGLSASLGIWYSNAIATSADLEGPALPLGEGEAHTYVVLNEQNEISEVGVILPATALADLPTESVELNLALPPAAIAQTPFTHVGLNWNPHGHMPDPIYGVPHFDVHFYTITEAARQRITTTQLDQSYVEPDAEYVPMGYVMAPESAEPTQGAHWVDPNAHEFQGDPHGFEHTFIYGFYDGRLSFMEPMVALPFLEQQSEVNEAIALPAQFSLPGAYPQGYRISYETKTEAYRIALTDFQITPQVPR